MTDRPTLMVIIASTRPQRVGKAVAEWLVTHAVEHGAFDIDVVDLKELDLPMMDEPEHPMLGRYHHEHTKAWSARVAAADAFVMVTPEYNHSFTAPLKNAIDYLNKEWKRKPVAIASYGGVSAGLRAATMLRAVLSALGMVATGMTVSIPMVRSFLDEAGEFQPNEPLKKAATGMLDELLTLHQVLAALRPPEVVS
ncbi:MAG TPA: NAD(P)H-dependent oxidoreductase [Trueperaceae bacterium]|nr:NAD(P)H-dependent oxidoreductase [Trueperaceae bacterium]